MILAEEHPEELIERERAGLASADEQERLNAHLAVCEECRAERTLAQHAQADAAPLPDEARVVARLQRRLAERRPAVQAAWITRLRSPTTLVVFALTLASSAAAALILERVIRPRPPADTLSPSDLDDASLSSGQSSSPALLPQEHDSHTITATTPQRLLAEAELARRASQPGKAAALYTELQRTLPGSEASVVSYVSLGQLLLRPLDDPGAALVQFNRYLAQPNHHALRAEALLGRALSLQRLGRHSEENAAWRALLHDYPSGAIEEPVVKPLETATSP